MYLCMQYIYIYARNMYVYRERAREREREMCMHVCMHIDVMCMHVHIIQYSGPRVMNASAPSPPPALPYLISTRNSVSPR